jgi:hypothetical protein
LSAGEVRLPPVSSVVPVEVSGFYLGIGGNLAVLKDGFTGEEITSRSLSLIAGYRINEYVALEGRFARSVRTPSYTGPVSQTLNTAVTDLGGYLKLSFPLGALSPYLLAGYGLAHYSNLSGVSRTGYGLRRGVGLSYRIGEHLLLFGDYIRAYDAKGFDGLGRLDTIRIHHAAFGLIYHF